MPTSRYHYIKHSLDAALNFYQSPYSEPQRELLQHLGYSAAHLGYLYNPSSYRVLTASRGVVDMRRDERIAVSSLTPAEQFVIKTIPHRLQNSHPRLSITAQTRQSIRKGAAATTNASFQRFVSEGKKVHEYGKPNLIVEYDTHRESAPLSSVAHEIVHVAQLLDRPIRAYDIEDAYAAVKDQLTDEIQAYAVEASIPDVGEMPRAIDTFRQKHLGKDGYNATDTFVEAIRKDSVMRGVFSEILRDVELY